MRGWAIAAALALFGQIGVSSLPAATSVWNEGTQGDISSNFNSPTDVGTLGFGTWSVTATSGSVDREFVHMTIPSGMAISTIVPSSYIPGDGTSFIGVGAGTIGPDPAAAPGNLLGYAHFGTGPGNVGANIEPTMSTGAGSQTFTPPLGGGDYVFWMQQAGASTTFTMEFNVTPEPGSIGLIAMVGVAFIRRRRVHAR